MRHLFLALLSGLLLAFSWPAIGFFPFIFFAFIPLLMLESQEEKGRVVFLYSYITFFSFNILTTYWIWYATPSGAVFAFLVNSLFMSVTFFLFHKIKSFTSNRLGYLSLVMCWLAFEYLHLNWDLSWPWLSLGNVFSEFPNVVQWYEYTGVLGGTLWVLLINILVFHLIKSQSFNIIITSILLIVLPVLFSYAIIPDLQAKDQLNVLVVQPNIDPYTDKFSISHQKQLNEFIKLAETRLKQETDLLVGPETVLQEGIWENNIEDSYSVRAFRMLQKEYSNLNVIVGASTYRMFSDVEKKTSTARKIIDKNIFYDAYNSAIFIPDSGKVSVYHKTKLVPGAEKTPFPKLLDRFTSVMLDLGGISGSLGSENESSRFDINEYKLQPLICYESIYGDLQEGSTDLIIIITNDGWWKDTPGYKQHLSYARLRSIEKRKTIVRAANTGISAIINERGKILQNSEWNEISCLSANININQINTFYSIYGDYIGRISTFIAFMLLIISFVKCKIKK